MKLTRRKFTKVLGAITISIPYIGYGQMNPVIEEPSNIFFDESGTLPGDGIFVIGSVKCVDQNKCLSVINLLRQKHDYRCELKYRSRDKYKLSYALDLIDFFFNEPSLSFHSRLILGNLSAERDDYFEYLNHIYKSNYQKLHDDLMVSKSDILNVERRNIEETEMPFFQTSASINWIKQKENDILQLTDLLTGSIYGQAASVKNSIKTEILKKLNGSLGTSSLLDISDEGKFSITQIKI